MDGNNLTGAMETADWRTQLLPDSRHRIVNRIMETLERHLPISGPEGLQELNKIAVRFEEKIFDAATSQVDYLRKISLKMLTMETKAQNPLSNSILPNAASSSQNAHAAEMMAEEVADQAIEEETDEEQASEEETDEEQATEEDDGDESEDSEVTEEQNSAAGHKENVDVGENEISCGLSSGAKLDHCPVHVEERLKKIEADVEEVKTMLADVNKKLDYLVKIQEFKVRSDIRRPARYMRSSWAGNGQLKRKHRIVEIIRQSCKHRRLGKAAVEEVSTVALQECAKDDPRMSDEGQKS